MSSLAYTAIARRKVGRRQVGADITAYAAALQV